MVPFLVLQRLLFPFYQAQAIKQIVADDLVHSLLPLLLRNDDGESQLKGNAPDRQREVCETSSQRKIVPALPPFPENSTAPDERVSGVIDISLYPAPWEDMNNAPSSANINTCSHTTITTSFSKKHVKKTHNTHTNHFGLSDKLLQLCQLLHSLFLGLLHTLELHSQLVNLAQLLPDFLFRSLSSHRVGVVGKGKP